jgi:hypothetical protein
MRNLWRVIAYIGEDGSGFNDGLVNAHAGFDSTSLLDNLRVSSVTTDPRILSLSNQPDQAALDQLDKYLRARDQAIYPDLRLSAYELSEVNRLIVAGNGEIPFHKSLKAYWTGLNQGQGAASNRGSLPFMEAVGALAIDKSLRDNLRQSNDANLLSEMLDQSGQPNRFYFNLTASQSQLFFNQLQANSPAEVAAQSYFQLGWPVPVCASVATPTGPLWFHINM